MRGKAIFARYFSARSGITPAYAGKSYRQSGRQRDTRDHPRLCGEKFVLLLQYLHRIGSPPPMRGKASERVLYRLLSRITPAYAGKSVYTYLILESCTGSPPPMRGKAFFRKTFFTGRRITPAYAGKRGGRLRRHCESEDHPRLCGEK